MKNYIYPEARQNLIERYSEPHRKYHNLEHILCLFELATLHHISLSIPQYLAIWYHDSIYATSGNVENEIRSAELLYSHLTGFVSTDKLQRAYDIILATKKHISDINEIQVVLDLDLAGLGFSYDAFQRASDNIREEYKHLSDEIFYPNRKLFLNSLLAREYIFNTNWGRDFYERRARSNIERELARI